MDRFQILGGSPLQGEVSVSGAKNAALPILCASLLTAEPLVLSNVPRLRDVSTMKKLLAQMGTRIETVAQQSDGQEQLSLHSDAMITLRASEHRGSASFALAGSLARASLGEDQNGTRAEFLELVTRAQSLDGALARRTSEPGPARGR